ncbi:MAG: NTP transferase domain-containing protein [Christensenellaceae bacterium]|jgi:glucose-1-phosphate thymidylyltransferase|nr:NTP transferase domain-containing protein [Christensenellaceae bacterium]
MKAILLCGGYGTRMQAISNGKPKCLLELEDGKPIIDYIAEELDYIEEIDEAIVITNAVYYDALAEWAKNSKYHFLIKTINDNTTCNENRLGAIGDICYTIRQENLNDDLLILATDNHFAFRLYEYYDFCKIKQTSCILGQHTGDKSIIANKYACADIDENNLVRNIEEKPTAPKTDIAVYAVYYIKKEDVKYYLEYEKTGENMDSPGNFIPFLITKTSVHLFPFTEYAIDIGTPHLYYEAIRYVKGERV